MKQTFLISNFFYAAVTTVLLIALLHVAVAQVRTSSNYQLQSDSINIGGGFSSSTNYLQESTVGEMATGNSSSSNYALRAGYQQMQEVFISLSATGDVTMDTDLPGIGGGTSNGSTTVTVTTDSPSGYRLTIQAENSPAMQSGSNSIADYDAGVETDYVFTVNAGEALFGFTPEGVDIVQAFKDDGAGTCNVDAQDTPAACWDGLSTSETIIAEGIGANHPDGATTTVWFRVGIANGAGVETGLYTATTTVTAIPL